MHAVIKLINKLNMLVNKCPISLLPNVPEKKETKDEVN